MTETARLHLIFLKIPTDVNKGIKALTKENTMGRRQKVLMRAFEATFHSHAPEDIVNQINSGNSFLSRELELLASNNLQVNCPFPINQTAFDIATRIAIRTGRSVDDVISHAVVHGFQKITNQPT